MKKVLYINHSFQKCGVYEFGYAIGKAIEKSKKFNIKYVECDTLKDFKKVYQREKPDVVIYNYHPYTLSWISKPGMRMVWYPTYQFNTIHVGMIHEIYQEYADNENNMIFDFHVCADPTLLLKNPIIYKTGRLVPVYKNGQVPVMNAVPSIGSFGFAGPKQYLQIVEQVQKEFDEANININISFARFGDENGKLALEMTEELKRAIYKDKVKLNVTHNHYSQEGLLEFLGKNDINVFCYKYQKNRGISSSTDWALAVDKPVAVNKCMMFRHLFEIYPSICIEDTPLKNILNEGTEQLRRKREDWSEENMIWDYDRIIASVLERERTSAAKKMLQNVKNKIKRHISKTKIESKAKIESPWLKHDDEIAFDGFADVNYTPVDLKNNKLNRLLDNAARELYAPAIDLVSKLSPGIIKKKIPAANVQQGFVFDTAFRFAADSKKKTRILTVGAFEDTASLALKKLGFAVDEIDPEINYDINAFITKPSVKPSSYDMIISTSVIEHVKDDERFLQDINYMLKPRGIAILTCDFHNGYTPGFPVPKNDLRFYTKKDLTERLLKVLPDCYLLDEPAYDAQDYDFFILSYNYTFATFVFRKK